MYDYTSYFQSSWKFLSKFSATNLTVYNNPLLLKIYIYLNHFKQISASTISKKTTKALARHDNTKMNANQIPSHIILNRGTKNTERYKTKNAIKWYDSVTARIERFGYQPSTSLVGWFCGKLNWVSPRMTANAIQGCQMLMILWTFR